MGRFEKLNNDVQGLADMVLADKDLCKLIYYSGNNPLDQPDTNFRNVLLNDKDNQRLFTFTPKIPLAEDEGTYLSITTPRLKPVEGGHYVVSLLCFNIYSHKDIREIYYKDKYGNSKVGDRAILMMDRIEKIMLNANLGIGQENMDGAAEIASNNAVFSGYTVGYVNVDFRNQGG